MQSPFIEVVTNKIFVTTILAWLVSQSIKIATALVLTKRFNFRLLLGTGGMPSSHAAAVSALAISVGKATGFDSPLCIITIVFALITMFDAQGVRRAAGAQAAILNKMVEEIYFNRGIRQQRLKELLGHTPVEVFAGALLGAVVAFLSFR
jgi:acid phosphatase family membrane protein YuiD